MITYVVSDLFQSPARVLVNAVNTVGVMGKGIAADFRRFYPEMFAQYQALCERGQFQTGQLWLYKTPHKWILNFPTKQHWRDPSRLEYIEAGLQKFAAVYAEKDLISVSFPLLGSGLGGLDWEMQVRPLMEHYLDPLPIDIFIHLYEPNNPFASTRDDEALSRWLSAAPPIIPFARFFQDVVALVKQQHNYETLDDHTPFEAVYDDAERRILLSPGGVILSESTLADVWHYIRAAGYTAPGSLPAGPDAHAGLIVALLSRLDYVHPVYIERAAGRQIGLHLLAHEENGL
ncbi:MAG: macro domain-containing protein [Anaerolineae bacterium]|nr:macro domain-containing protein [Anaerolineae bacterium]